MPAVPPQVASRSRRRLVRGLVRGLVRRLITWLVRLALLLVVLLETLYLARRPLLEGPLRERLQALLGRELRGEAAIGGIGGDWLTRIRLEGVAVRTPGVLREIRDAAADVQLDPWALVRGDLGGVRRARVRAAAFTLDLATPGPPGPAGAPGTPPDLGALAALLPGGAVVEVDAFALLGAHARIAGGVRVHLAPAPPGAVRRAVVHGPGVVAEGRLHRDGRIEGQVALDDPARVPRLFTPLAGLEGGRLRGGAVLRVAPAFACDAKASVDGLRAAGRAVERLEVEGHVGDAGLQEVTAVVEAPGVDVSIAGASLVFADVAGTVTGRALVDLRDTAPYGDLVPDAVRAQLPLTGWLRVRAAHGRLEVDDGRLHGTGASLDLRAGALALTGTAALETASPVGFTLRILEPATLPLPVDLPLRPTGGAIEGHVGRQAGALVIEGDVDLPVADAQAHAGRVRGHVRLAAAAGVALAADLRATGDLLRGYAGEARLRGNAQLDAEGLRLEGVELALDGRAAATADGLLAAGDAVLERSALQVTASALPVAPLAALGGLGPARGRIDGTVALRPGELEVALALAVDQLPAAGGLAVEGVVRAVAGAEGVRIEECALESVLGLVRVHGRLAGMSLRSLARAEVTAAEVAPDLRLELELREIERIDLASLLGLRLRGAIRAQGALRGTLRAPVPEVDIELDRFGLGTTLRPDLLRAAAGSLRLTGDTLRIADVDLELAGQRLALAAEIERRDRLLAIRSLRVTDGFGGVLQARGELDLGRAGDLAAFLGAAATLEADLHDCALDPWLALAGIESEDARARGRIALLPGARGLSVTLAGEAERLRLGGQALVPSVSITLHADARGTRLESLRVELDGLRAEGRGSLGLPLPEALADPAAAAGAPLELSIDVSHASLAALPAGALGFAELHGDVRAGLRLTGTAREPELAASVQVAGGRVVTATGQRFEDLAARLRCSATEIHIEELHATRGKGPLRVTGTLRAPGPIWRHWADGELDLTITGDNVLVHRRAGVKVRADLALRATGPLSDFLVRGDIALRDSTFVARLPLLDLRSRGGRAATEGLPLPSLDLGPGRNARLDVRVTTKEPFTVRNNVLDGDLHVQLAVGGDLRQPLLQGTVSGPDSALILPGMRLRAATLLLEFAAHSPRFPTLTVHARGRRHGFDVQAVVRGRYDHPDILLSSDPPLPADDLLVLVTTGARPQSIEGARGVGTVLGTYLAQELADWIFGSESTEAKESFLDRFTVETGTEISRAGTESVVVEFRVVPGVFLQGERDVYEDLNMGVVYRVRFR